MLKVRVRLTAVREDGGVGLFIHPEDRKYVHAVYKDYLDRKVECDLVVQPHVKTRTLPMNDMWEGMCRKIAKETKHTFEAIRNYTKENYGTYEKLTVPVHDSNGGIVMQDKYVQKSTAKYSIEEMSDLIMGTFSLGSDFGVDLSGEKKDYDAKKKELVKV